MQLRPVYGDRPLIVIDLPATGPVHPAIAQRRRFQALLADLSDEEWAHPSRCDGWSVQDVVTHLNSTNQFWAWSIRSGLDGAPTELLATFDPVSSPAELVAAAGEVPPAETLAAFVAGNDAFAAVAEDLDDEQLRLPAESPAGHVSIRSVLDHALWDSLIHERDVVVPLGRPVVDEDDEVRTALRYAAALGPGFSVMVGAAVDGATVVDATDPDERFVVSVEGDQVRLHDGSAPDRATVLTGRAASLLEHLSFRDDGTPAPPEVSALNGGLGEIFEA